MNTPAAKPVCETDAETRRNELFRRQKALLDTFLVHGAITRAQYDKSLNCLIEKMGIGNMDTEQRSEKKEERP